MDKLFEAGSVIKSKKDARFSLILIVGFVFLSVLAMRIAGWNTSKIVVPKGYFLKVDNTSLSVITEEDRANELIIPIPWELTPLFFKKMPINSVDKNALMTIKGVGPKLADSILQSRLENGLFKKSSDLLKIRGIGPKRALYFERMFDFSGE